MATNNKNSAGNPPSWPEGAQTPEQAMQPKYLVRNGRVCVALFYTADKKQVCVAARYLRKRTLLVPVEYFTPSNALQWESQQGMNAMFYQKFTVFNSMPDDSQSSDQGLHPQVAEFISGRSYADSEKYFDDRWPDRVKRKPNNGASSRR